MEHFTGGSDDPLLNSVGHGDLGGVISSANAQVCYTAYIHRNR